jgi:hypothetical protein
MGSFERFTTKTHFISLKRQVVLAALGNGYVTASFQGLGGSWLVVDWDAIRLPAALTAR